MFVRSTPESKRHTLREVAGQAMARRPRNKFWCDRLRLEQASCGCMRASMTAHVLRIYPLEVNPHHESDSLSALRRYVIKPLRHLFALLRDAEILIDLLRQMA